MIKLMLFFIFIVNICYAERYVVKFDKVLSSNEVSALKQLAHVVSVEHFHNKAPFNQYYILNTAQVISLSHPNLLSIQLEGSVESLSVIPSSNGALNSNFLYNYQWSLDASDQVIINDIDDINSEEVKASAIYDVKFKNIKSEPTDKEVIIAVIDHGVDTDHPDLENRIFKNKQECSSTGNVRFKPIEDLDRNGYAGDCNGMDFSENLQIGNPVVKDKNGHGTHVAGIIAAEDNSKGIVGLAANALILPVKVFATEKGQERNTNSNLAPATVVDRIAKAIIFAADSHSRIINLSLGWPRSLDNDLIREAIRYAQDKNVIIVAAAGNNSNNTTISPCNYKGVICVGASRADGKWASFSNFGGNVDIVAPGEQIISTHPEAITSKSFFLNGYEIKNGTSQAAPLVAGYLGYLMGKHPSKTNEELIAHLYSSSLDIQNESKFSSFGLMQISKSNDDLLANVFKPEFKGLEMLLVKNGVLSLPLKIKSYSQTTSTVSIIVRSLSNNITLSEETFNRTIDPFGVTELVIQGRLLSEMADNEATIEVEIISDGFTRKFINRMTLINDTLERAVTYSIDSSIDLSKISTIPDSLDLFKTPTYSVVKFDEKLKSLSLCLMVKNETSIRCSTERTFSDVLQFVSLMKLDSNYDRREDYILKVLSIVDGKRILKVYYLDENLKSLYSEFDFLLYNPEGALGKKLNFLPLLIEGKKIASEVFVESGDVPRQQLSLNPFLVQSNEKSLRIYSLRPVKVNGSWQLQTVMINDDKFEEIVKKEYSETAYLYYLNMTPMNATQYYAGHFDLLTFIDDVSSKSLRLINIDSYYDIKLSGKFSVNQNPNTFFKPSYDITSTPSRNEELYGLYAQNDYKLTLFSPDGKKLKYTGDNKKDTIVGHIATFVDSNGPMMFLQTKNKLKLVKEDAVLEKSITRFSFLPGTLLTDIFYPITVFERGEFKPAIYVDGTSISTNHISIVTEKDKQLISPVKYSLHVPKNCRTLNPVFDHEYNTFKYVLLCKNGAESKMLEVVLVE